MTRDRGVSTPLDVALGILLIGAAVGVIVGIQPVADPGPSVGGSVMLGSPLEVTYQTEDGSATVSGTMGGLIGDATLAGHGTVSARDRAFREAVRARVDERLDTDNRPVQLVGYCRGSRDRNPLVAGRAVPPDRPIRATVYDIPASSDDIPGTPDGSGGTHRETTVPDRPSQVRDEPSHSATGPVRSPGHSPAPGVSATIRLGASGGHLLPAGSGDRPERAACEPAIVVRRWSR